MQAKDLEQIYVSTIYSTLGVVCEKVTLEHTTRVDNLRAHVLSKLESTKKKERYRSLLQQVLTSSYMEATNDCMAVDKTKVEWMMLYIRYLKTREVP